MKRKATNQKKKSAELRALGTEKANAASTDLDRKSALDIARIINAEDAKVTAAVKKALDIVGYHKVTEEQRKARAEGRLVGIGMSTYGEICAFGPSPARHLPVCSRFGCRGDDRALSPPARTTRSAREDSAPSAATL